MAECMGVNGVGEFEQTKVKLGQSAHWYVWFWTGVVVLEEMEKLTNCHLILSDER